MTGSSGRCSSVTSLSSVRDQFDGLLRARRDAEPTGLAGRGTRRVGRLFTMRHALQLAEQAELGEVPIVDPAHLEHVVWANIDAVALSLALGSVDDGNMVP